MEAPGFSPNKKKQVHWRVSEGIVVRSLAPLYSIKARPCRTGRGDPLMTDPLKPLNRKDPAIPISLRVIRGAPATQTGA